MTRTETLHSDLSCVETRKRRFSKVEKKITDYTAPVDEVLDWYCSQDPADETWNLKHLKSLKRLTTPVGYSYAESWEMMVEADRLAMEKADLYIHGSTILLGNILYPEVVGRKRAQQCKIFEALNSSNPIEELPELTTKLSDFELEQKGVQQVGLAADMLTAATRKFSLSSVGTNLTFYRKMMKLGGYSYVEGTPKKTTKNLKKLSENLYGIAFEAAFNKIDNPNMAKLCVQMLVKHIAPRMNAAKPRSKDAYNNLDQLVQTCQLIIDNDSLAKIDQGVLKGFWHEIIWYLDFNILKQVKKCNLNIAPALSFEDSPHNDNPTLNRGYDYRVSGKRVEKSIQLKSSKRAARGKTPHPVIDKVVEYDFTYDNEVIMDKLALYRKYIDSRFNNRFNEVVIKEILESVRTVTDGLLTKSSDSRISRLNHEYETGAVLGSSAVSFFSEVKEGTKKMLEEAGTSENKTLKQMLIDLGTNPKIMDSDAVFANRAMRRAAKKRK